MPPEDANDASQQQDVSLDDLHRAAEEARSFIENEPVVDREEKVSDEPADLPADTGEADQEDKEAEREEQQEEPPEPKDNKERSQLGRKVAALEGTLKVYEQQIQQTNQTLQILTSLLQQKEAAPGMIQGQEAEEEDEYIPSTRKEFDALLERRIAQLEQRKVQEQTVQRTQYETGYLSTLTKLGAEADDSALHEEAVKLSTEAGAPYNVIRTGNPLIDAETNYYAAQAHVLKQRLARPKKDETPKNPLKGDPPRAPLGAPSGMAPKVKEVPKIKLDDDAKRAARKMGLSDKDVAEYLGA